MKRATATVIGAVLGAGVLATAAFAQSPLILGDLAVPRGITASADSVLVADQGNGRIIRVAPDGTVTELIGGIPSTQVESPEGLLTVGVTGVIEANGGFFFTTGEAAAEGFQSVYFAVPGVPPVLMADLGAYEEANNTDDDLDRAGNPELLSNPYDLVSDGAGGVFVSDSGANAILHISAEGAITPFAIFPNRENPLFPGVGGPTMDQVPTGLEIGPDGALYLSTLTGFPFPANAARVYRVEDMNGDGDALDDGEIAVFAEGLTTATNLAFDRDGSLLVTEFSTDMLAQAPGRLVRVRDGAVAEVVAAPLISPTGVAVMSDGRIVVNQEFLGLIGEPAAFAAAPPPAPVPAETGNAGESMANDGSVTTIGLALLAAVAIVGAGRRLARAR